MTYQQWISQACLLLKDSESPKRDAQILLSVVTGKSISFFLAFGETVLLNSELTLLEPLLKRRISGEPIAYITGVKEFWSLPLSVSTATLIPRPDTELLVELALAYLPRSSAAILDLGTGSGAIALAIASERKDCEIIGVDCQEAAVALAQSNAESLNINNVRFIQGSWFEPLGKKAFDLIVSNPPYIDGEDPHLFQGDVRFEPKTALVSGHNGLADISIIVACSRRYLKRGGWLMIEHGWRQGEAVKAIFDGHGFSSVTTEKDYGGNDRVTLGCSAP